jgi:3-methyladenine DNA glycosylase AlkD
MRTRYGITAAKAFGVPMAAMQRIGRQLGRDHALAGALWQTGWYEARMVASFIDDPALVTPAQMDRWVRGMDNWAIGDTVCFFLFDRTPHAWRKVELWSRRRDEFVKRTAFALLACLALHDKQAADKRFVRLLPVIERGATDKRNFVKKGVSWALRAIGRRNPALNESATETAERLAASSNSTARWIGKDALRDLARAQRTSETKKKDGTRRDRTRFAHPS